MKMTFLLFCKQKEIMLCVSIANILERADYKIPCVRPQELPSYNKLQALFKATLHIDFVTQNEHLGRFTYLIMVCL